MKIDSKISKNNSLRKDQRGLASVVVTVFVMIILSLVVLAFSQVTRREQRQALDRQLSTQAYYAAEAGINDAVNKIRNGTLTDIEKTICDDTPIKPENKLDTNNVVSYSCLLYDKAPRSIEYGSVGTETSQVVSLKTADGAILRELTFSWSDDDGGASFAGCEQKDSRGSFPSSEAYASSPGGCDAGMLRLLLMPITALDREGLVNSSYTVYLRPVSNGDAASNSTNYSPHSGSADGQGYVAPAYCDAGTGKCTATIKELPGTTAMFMDMRSYYKANSVTISGSSTTGTSVRFTEAQMKVDVTGKAGDVLRRLQVRVPVYEQYMLPGYVNESMNGICKRISIVPAGSGHRTNDSDCGITP